MKLISLLSLLATLASAAANDVLLVKNQFEHRLYVRANGEWQGYVEPGRLARIPQHGLIKIDRNIKSENLADYKPNYGGWSFKGRYNIEAISAVFEEGGEPRAFYIRGEISDNRGAKSWVFGDGSKIELQALTDQETRNTVEFQRGEPPKEVLDLLVSGTAQVTLADQKPATGAVSGSSKFVLEKAGSIGASATFTNSLGIQMIRVPTDHYFLAATETTQSQWSTVMGDKPSKFLGERLPVEQVNRKQCIEFCRRLTERERKAGKLPQGNIYSLPSSPQWEKACLAGAQGEIAGPLDEMAWYDGNSSQRTQPVATKRPNVWGFFDMQGNVREWCLSPEGSDRTNRGGCWLSEASECGISRFDQDPPDVTSVTIGFRVALVPAP
jgi:formylglycine-generating enzyme